MANPLQTTMPPEAPQPMQGQPQPNALATPQGQQQAVPPPPTHAQTVAALRHFSAIQNELQDLLKNPDIGKADIKSAIIDGTTKLVADRIISPADAVTTLSSVPTAPFQQKQWVMQHLQTTMVAKNAIVDHHAQGNPGTMDMGAEAQGSQGNPDDHMKTMAGLAANYRGGSN